jgi:hypothetical protein
MLFTMNTKCHWILMSHFDGHSLRDFSQCKLSYHNQKITSIENRRRIENERLLIVPRIAATEQKL